MRSVRCGEGHAVTSESTDTAAGLTVRELARRYGVAPSTIGSAILRGARQGRPAPEPLYADRVTGARHFHPAAFDRWWRDRPRPQRSHHSHPARSGDGTHSRRRIVDVLPDLSTWPTEPGPVVPDTVADQPTR
jgi:hypothetical protein